MRLFVAIEIPADTRDELLRVQQRLAKVAAARWTSGQQLHITLKFLGEVPDQQLPEIIDALRGVAVESNPRLGLERVVCFPPHGPIRIIAAGLSDAGGLCAKLHQRIEQACHGAGFELEGRPWTAHTTLGRAKDRLGPQLRQKFEQAAGIGGDYAFDVQRFVLMQSQQASTGPQYHVAASFDLAGT